MGKVHQKITCDVTLAACCGKYCNKTLLRQYEQLWKYPATAGASWYQCSGNLYCPYKNATRNIFNCNCPFSEYRYEVLVASCEFHCAIFMTYFPYLYFIRFLWISFEDIMLLMQFYFHSRLVGSRSDPKISLHLHYFIHFLLSIQICLNSFVWIIHHWLTGKYTDCRMIFNSCLHHCRL